MASFRRAGRFLPAAPGSRVTRLELFYDLVFVFAFLNVTTVVAEHLGVVALLSGLVVLALLWWCWVGFAALGNFLRADQGIVPLVGSVTVVALLVLTLSLPEALIDQPGGAPGPLVFAACYLIIRGLQVLVLAMKSPNRGIGLGRLILPMVVSMALILVAALLPDPTVVPWSAWLKLGLWTCAVGVEFAAGAGIRGSGVTVVSAGHWAERYALILLIALGESIIALGVGAGLAADLPLAWPLITAAVCGAAIIAALWWMYFDSLALGLEQHMHRTRDPDERAALARDAYVVLHFVLIAGAIFFALGLKRYLTRIGESDAGWFIRPSGIDDAALFGGVLIYITGLVALQWRSFRRVRPPRSSAPPRWES
ncbi:low temperature requirement protein A [Micromonospora radicis]|uniref:low temperature requirement protein A n=1 Tax=Micromonospora radicis TaxID=1894971 RepID=UPI001F257D21|nr:low temperature requirement protein A [Micromonospora radicis]